MTQRTTVSDPDIITKADRLYYESIGKIATKLSVLFYHAMPNIRTENGRLTRERVLRQRGLVVGGVSYAFDGSDGTCGSGRTGAN